MIYQLEFRVHKFRQLTPDTTGNTDGPAAVHFLLQAVFYMTYSIDMFTLLCQAKFAGKLQPTLLIMHYVKLVGDPLWSQIWYDLYSHRS